jgi:DNA-binding MarR family transcriptional regulator
VASPQLELERFLPYRLSVLANVVSSAIASAYDERFGLSIPEWRVIAVLTRYPRLSARDVADKSRMDAVAVSRAVNRLLRAGRLRRTVDARDRRRSVLEVSAAGAAVYRQIAPLALRFERDLLAALPPGRGEALHEIVGVLTERAEQLSPAMRTPRAARKARPPRATRRRKGQPG